MKKTSADVIATTLDAINTVMRKIQDSLSNSADEMLTIRVWSRIELSQASGYYLPTTYHGCLLQLRPC